MEIENYFKRLVKEYEKLLGTIGLIIVLLILILAYIFILIISLIEPTIPKSFSILISIPLLVLLFIEGYLTYQLITGKYLED